MDITGVRVQLIDEGGLRGFATVVLDDCFVVRDLRVIDGPRGLFVAMPYRKLADTCPGCRRRNPLKARFCNECGQPLAVDRILVDGQGRPQVHADGRPKYHSDIAHPADHVTRQRFTTTVLAAYQRALGGEGDAS